MKYLFPLLILIITLSACKDTKNEVIDEDGRIEITLFVFSNESFLREQVTAFNNNNTDYYITINDFYTMSRFNLNEYSDSDHLDSIEKMNEALQQLDISIVTNGKNNKPPDIIYVSSDLYRKYANLGALADLTEYYQRDIDTTAVYDNVFEALKVNEILYGITHSFSISPIYMNKAAVTLDHSLEAMIKQQSEADYSLVGGVSKMEAFDNWLRFYINDFIDWEAKICNFATPNFIKILELVNNQPAEADYNDFLIAIREKKPIISHGSVGFPHSYQAFYNLLGGELVCYGYPWGDDEFIINSHIFSILKSSPHIEIAWEFISSFIDDSYQTKQIRKNNYSKPYDIPISRNAFDLEIEKNLKVESGEQSKSTMKMEWVLFETVEIPYVEAEAMEDYKRILEQGMRLDIWDDTIYALIREEVSAYFEGNLSVEQVAGYLNNRVQLYLNENQ